ncbi:hypothetical protein [Deinococcus sp. RM]|uniref:hypothetical protein n=1 Tax=Deinococcus sp. RM TaxID=2316359 RepID=UPI000E6830AF|nr:hypothetical protein [Deinococcus sp. RM]RIY04240.1 hypothetical protein D3W47_12065 [Deinococcus sp. RM]
MRKYILTTLLAAASSAFAIGTPAGTAIDNTAVLDLNDGTTTTSITSTAVRVNVTQVYNVSITPNGTTAAPGQTSIVTPGQVGVLTYTVSNLGNGTDTINLAAAAANANAQGANILGIFLDNPTTGTVGGYDADDTLITNLASVPADGTRTVFVRYTTPTGTTGGAAADTSYLLNITGTSAGDATKTDSNNVGEIKIGRVVDLSLTTPIPSKTVPAGGSVTFTDTLTNTGNTTLTAAEITGTVGRVTVNGATSITDTFTVSYTVTGGQGGTATNTDLEAALNAAIGTGLTAGSILTITVTVTPDATAGVTSGAKDGDKLTLTLETYSPLASSIGSSALKNNAAQGDTQGIITNTTTVQRGVGSVLKKVALCTTATTCPTYDAAGTADISAKPGDYVVYYLNATNTGTGKLFSVKLKDALPANFVATTLGGATNMTGGTLKYSTDGTTWNADVTTLGPITGGTTTLYVAYENGGTTTTIDNSDSLDGGKSLQMKIVGYIRNTGTGNTGTAPDNTSGNVTADSTGLSY